MRDYLIKRLLFTIITVLILSICIFALVQVPPGDAVDQMVASRGAQGDAMSPEEIAQLKAMYGLDRPLLERYWVWMTGLMRGDMGLSTRGMPVAGMVKEVLPQTIALSLLTLAVTYIIAVPIGIYSATHQYSLGDYLATGFGFIGLATPGFLLGIILLYVSFQFFGISIGGFFSPEFKSAPWSAAKVADLIQHLWVPVIVIAMGSTAGLIRTLRATLLDELSKQYVITARAKGLPWRMLLFKYPVRLALNPIIAGIGGIFPYLLAGQTIVAIVLNLPTLGPLLYDALLTQDIALASSVLLIMSLLGIFGVVVSDVLLAVLDPRIRFEKGA